MMKTSKILGTVALSAALAMGVAVPAFATDIDNTDDSVDTPGAGFETHAVTGKGEPITKDTKDNAKTEINLRTETDVINCTLPLKMTVVAKVTGGPILCPSEKAYKIVNENEDSALYVTGVVAALDEMWEPASNHYDSTDSVNAPTATDKYGKVSMGLQAGTENAVELVGGNKVLSASDAASKVNWKIAKKVSGATDNVLGLALSGNSSKISGIDTDNTSGETLITVTYTVSAMPTTAATTLAS